MGSKTLMTFAPNVMFCFGRAPAHISSITKFILLNESCFLDLINLAPSGGNDVTNLMAEMQTNFFLPMLDQLNYKRQPMSYFKRH